MSRCNQPGHAGLLAFDTEIFVDEVRFSAAYTDTLDQIRRCTALAEDSPPPPAKRLLGIWRMSATMPDQHGGTGLWH